MICFDYFCILGENPKWIWCKFNFKRTYNICWTNFKIHNTRIKFLIHPLTKAGWWRWGHFEIRHCLVLVFKFLNSYFNLFFFNLFIQFYCLFWPNTCRPLEREDGEKSNQLTSPAKSPCMNATKCIHNKDNYIIVFAI